MFNLGRNDKCWCGSGKKYKQCHERKDEEMLEPWKAKGYPIPKRDLILTPEQIEGVKESARLSVAIMDELDEFIKEGVSTLEIDELVKRRTAEAGAICADLGYNGFPKNCCTSINDVICHGIPCREDILQEGDIINVDITNILNGYYADMSRMYMIGKVSDNAKRLVEVTKKSMEIGIEQIKPYAPVGNIGNAIHDYIDDNGYSVVRALCGHGVGLKFHSEPSVEHFRSKKKSLILVPGMVLTVEPMINEGDFDCEVLDDDWTVVTKDGSLSAQWEHTILVTDDGYEILTK